MKFISQCASGPGPPRTIATVAFRAHSWVRLMLAPFSGRDHSPSQQHESEAAGIKLQSQFKLDLRMFYDSSI